MVSNILKSEKVRFLIRVIVAFAFLGVFLSYYDFIANTIAPFINNLISSVHGNLNYFSGHGTKEIFTYENKILIYLLYTIGTYFYFKVFGVFKNADKLSSPFTFLAIVACIVVNAFYIYLTSNSNNMYLKFNVYLREVTLFILCFFLHKFFNFLTKKYPIPFEKIGYYTSIECLNDFYNNHKNHKQIEETKEIEKTSFIHKILKSEKFNFILRTTIAFLLFPLCFLLLCIASIFFIIFMSILPIGIILIFIPNQYSSDFLITTLLLMFSICGPFLAVYLYLKIFGILKQSDKLNSFFVLFIFILGIGINYIYLYLTHSPDIIFYTMEFVGFFLAFFLHKFFNFLTKKFPTPFEQIGYYTSIEFVKDLLRPIYQKLRKDK